MSVEASGRTARDRKSPGLRETSPGAGCAQQQGQRRSEVRLEPDSASAAPRPATQGIARGRLSCAHPDAAFQGPELEQLGTSANAPPRATPAAPENHFVPPRDGAIAVLGGVTATEDRHRARASRASTVASPRITPWVKGAPYGMKYTS